MKPIGCDSEKFSVCRPCDEQEAPAALTFTASRKAKTTMPEKNNGFMAELDRWTEETVIAPLYQAWADYEEAKQGEGPSEEDDQRLGAAEAEVKRAIREKTLESYRNGQAAGPRPGGEQPERKGEYRRPFRKSR